MPIEKLPDFSKWASSRMKTLLEDYQNIVHFYKNKSHKDVEIFKKWIKAIEEELNRRET
jgi:hypothetical protein